MSPIGLATFLADRLVSRETEYGQYGQKEL
jgi:hypothetical protein